MAKKTRNKFEKAYSEDSYWSKIKKYSIVAGKELVSKSLMLYYSAKHPNTPAWAKTVAWGALGYFISPIDAIPDFTPLIGYSDDLGVVIAALATIASYVTPDIKEQAEEKVSAWFD